MFLLQIKRQREKRKSNFTQIEISLNENDDFLIIIMMVTTLMIFIKLHLDLLDSVSNKKKRKENKEICLFLLYYYINNIKF